MKLVIFMFLFVVSAVGIASPPADITVSDLCQQEGQVLLQRHFEFDGQRKVSSTGLETSSYSTSLATSLDDQGKPKPIIMLESGKAAPLAHERQALSLAHSNSSLERVRQTDVALRARPRMSFSFYALVTGFLISLFLIWYCASQSRAGPDKIDHDLFSLDRGKVYVYTNDKLLTWRLLLNRAPSAVMSWHVWIVLPCVLAAAFGVALLVVFELPGATTLDTTRIDEFAKYLRVFIAFMLGLFMNNSFQRWHSAVCSFRAILTSVKQLIWTARVMHLRSDLVDELERKCLVACYILDAEMRTDLSCKAEDCKEHWDKTLKSLRDNELLTEKEDEALRVVRKGVLDFDMGGYSTMIWGWIGNFVGNIRSEPGLLVPMYVRLVSISHSSIGQVDQLRTSVQVQVPFTYAYLLSMIVHMNNAMLAVCCGLQIGAALSEGAPDDKELAESLSKLGGFYHTCEVFSTQIMIVLVQPLMYQACLVIAHVLNHPFGDEISHLPTETFILMLRDELQVLADSFDKSADDSAPKASDTDSSHDADDDDDDDDDDDGDDGDDGADGD